MVHAIQPRRDSTLKAETLAPDHDETRGLTERPNPVNITPAHAGTDPFLSPRSNMYHHRGGPGLRSFKVGELAT